MNNDNILFFSDIHIGNHLQLQDEFGKNVILNDIENALTEISNFIATNKIKYVIMLGDIFHSRHPSILEKSIFCNFVKKVTNDNVKIIVLIGNHDFIDDKLNTLTDLRKLQLSNLYIIDNVTICNINKTKFGFIPYNMYTFDNVKNTLNNVDVLCGHFGLNDIKAFKNDSYSINDFNIKNKTILLGHYHNYSKINNNTFYLGSIARLTFAEKDIKRKMFTFNTSTKKLKDINLKSRNFMQLRLNSIDDLIKQNFSKGTILKIELCSDDINIDAINNYCIKNKLYVYQITEEKNENVVIAKKQYMKNYEILLKKYLKKIDKENLYSLTSNILKREL